MKGRNNMSLPWFRTNNTLTIHVDGEAKSINCDSPHFQEAEAAIENEDWDRVLELMNPAQVLENSDDRFRVVSGQVLIQCEDDYEFKCPISLNDTIIRYMNESLDFDRLVKFAQKLGENTSASSARQLYDFIQHNDMTITEDGDFIAYKSVNADFTDCYTGKIDNSVGQVIRMARNEVDDDPEVTCSHGLHVAAFDYAHNVYAGAITLIVAVNPKDVISVPIDYNRQKMRTCKYKVIEVSEKRIESAAYNIHEDEDDMDMEDPYYDEYLDEDYVEGDAALLLE